MDMTACRSPQGPIVKPNKANAHTTTIRLDDRLSSRRDDAAPPVTTTQPGPGSMLGNYLIVNLIGEGGMGMVYKARDMVLDRTVALKILPPHLTQNPEFLHRIRTEAHAQARLHHPNIVTLYSVQELAVGFILVMEFVEGQTLHQRIQNQGPLDSSEAARIFDKVLQGVAYAHQMGIVHRDLKPDNIFLTRNGEVKIMDFGVAKILDNAEPTRSRSMVGTLLYISPEQINGRDADFRSDIYTLGISLFETVTGRLPFERKTDYALMHAHVLEQPARPRHLKRDLPKALERMILKAIEKEPERRYQSADEFRDTLLQYSDRRGLSDDRRTRATPATFGKRVATRIPMLNGLRIDALLIAVIVALGMALGLTPGQQRPPDDVEPVLHLAKKGAPPATPVPASNPSRQTESATPTGRQAQRDRYDSLRHAWGG